jgi:hypothetical protein
MKNSNTTLGDLTKMENEDDLREKIRTATTLVIHELGLSDNVRVSDVQSQIDSDRFMVDLTERTGPKESAYHRFEVEPIEALEAVHGERITVDALKPFVQRDLIKLFPATQE